MKHIRYLIANTSSFAINIVIIALYFSGPLYNFDDS